MDYYNTRRTHQGKHCQGRTPMQTFDENIPLAKEKNCCMQDDDFNVAA
jgi:hypothetical protein